MVTVPLTCRRRRSADVPPDAADGADTEENAGRPAGAGGDGGSRGRANSAPVTPSGLKS